MSSAAEVLVVILSAALAVFIILGIALFIMLIKLTRQIGDAAAGIQSITASVDEMVQNITRISSPIILGKTVWDMFMKYKTKEKNKNE